MKKLDAYCLVAALIFAAAKSFAWDVPAGEALESGWTPENLPVLYQSSRIIQVSSHDRTGGNNDGFDGAYSSLYRDEQGEFVLFDEVGAGCVNRIWITYNSKSLNPTNHIRFYFDEEASPRIDLSIEDFFSGNVEPFSSPLVGDRAVSSGGYYCYLPFPFKQRCRITLTAQPYFYNITGHRYPAAAGLSTWTRTADLSAMTEQWIAAGMDPKPTNGNDRIEGVLNLAVGETSTVFEVEHSGCLNGFVLDDFLLPDSSMSNIWIRMFWDNAPQPQVLAPIGDFFGCRYGRAEVQSLLFGQGEDSPFYSWFPMPWWENARIELVNASESAVTNLAYTLAVGSNRYEKATSGHFYAAHQSKQMTADDEGDFMLLDASGRGKVVAVVLAVENESVDPLGYLESDERVYIDGSATPSLYGTGLEDFFNGGWYFNGGTFSLPLHGHPMRKHEWHSDWGTPPYITNNFTTAYRIFSGEGIPFRSSIQFGIEHGTYSKSADGEYTSLVFYYAKPEANGLLLQRSIDVGNAASELAGQYAAWPEGVPVQGSWRYEGVHDDQVIMDSGMSYSGDVLFSVPVNTTNEGVLIRRRMDAVSGRQWLKVFVDEDEVGDWYSPDCTFSNLQTRWADSEFFISPIYTSGKESVSVRLSKDPRGADVWNAFRYEVFEVVSMLPSGDADADGLPDTWESQYFSNLSKGIPNQDVDEDRLDTFEEYVAGTDPTDRLSVLKLLPRNGTFSFVANADRDYHVWYTTNLLKKWTWVDSFSNSVGEIDLPDLDDNKGFYRIEVSVPSEVN